MFLFNDKSKNKIIQLITEKSCKKMIDTRHPLTENIFGQNNAITFVNNVTDFWSVITKVLIHLVNTYSAFFKTKKHCCKNRWHIIKVLYCFLNYFYAFTTYRNIGITL